VISPARDPQGFRAAAKEPCVLSIGSLTDEAKNILALERIARRLPWDVCIVGEEPLSTDPAKGVHYLGQIEPASVASWLGRASIYVLPARYEPAGLSVLEAALSGCALVLGDIPSLRENWDGAALFVPPDDPEMLHATVERLIVDRDYRLGLAACAQARALDSSPRRMVAQYVAAYQEVMQRTLCVS
jgi:glycogen synthase